MSRTALLLLASCLITTSAGCGSDPEPGTGSGGGEATSRTCPPEPPFGSGIGDTAIDLELYECDGTKASVHELCDTPAAVLYTFAAWCPVCRGHLNSGRPNSLKDSLAGAGGEVWVVVTEDSSGGAASPELCRQTEESFGLTTRVLYDPDNRLRDRLGLQVNSGGLVLSRGSRIELKVGYDFDRVEQLAQQLTVADSTQ